MTYKQPRQAIALSYDGQQAPTLSAKGDDELAEAIIHLQGYVGAPLVREALITAREVFAEMRAEAGGKK